MTTNPSECEMLLGSHLSIAGGIDKAADRAKELNINALQIFSHNVRSWSTRPLKSEEIEAFKRKRKDFGLNYAVAHTSYLLNLASPKDDLWEKSKRGLIEEIDRASKLCLEGVNTHIGAHTGSGRKTGLKRLTRALDEVASSEVVADSTVELILENTAGRGTTLGASFEELGMVMEGLSQPERFGVCLDTCHGFAAGYDFGSRKGLEGVLEEFDDKVGLEYLSLVHLNDSVGERGSNKDEHAHIGEGLIGIEGFAAVVNSPLLTNLPFILETPKERIGGKRADRINLDKIMELKKGR